METQMRAGAQTRDLFPGVVYDSANMALVTPSKRVYLTSTECDLLKFFLENPSCVRTKEEIAQYCFGSGSNTKAAYSLIYQLRNTICIASPVIPRKLSVVLVRGKGYRLAVH